MRILQTYQFITKALAEQDEPSKRYSPFIILVGPSASGKDTLAEDLDPCGYKKILSYTTRPKRQGEALHPTHVHIKPETMNQMLLDGKLAAYSKFDKHEYATAKEDFFTKDIAILDVKGLMSLELPRDMKRPIVVVRVNASRKTRAQRMLERGQTKREVRRRIRHDDYEFDELRMKYIGMALETVLPPHTLFSIVDIDTDSDTAPITNRYNNLVAVVGTLQHYMRDYSSSIFVSLDKIACQAALSPLDNV